VEPRGREKPRLRQLTPEQRRAIDALLLRVYQQAARELGELEVGVESALSPEEAARIECTNRARDELMQALRDWEARHNSLTPTPKP